MDYTHALTEKRLQISQTFAEIFDSATAIAAKYQQEKLYVQKLQVKIIPCNFLVQSQLVISEILPC